MASHVTPSKVKDVSPDKFIAAFAAYLKRTNKLEVPGWADFVKTGKTRELAPIDEDWVYIRAAAVARKVYLRPNLGVGAITKLFGGQSDRGVRPGRFERGSGKVARYLLQQLERINVVEKDETEKLKGKHGGRRITKHGQRMLDSIAKQISESA
jgi:small subunit ribosomal protein S19e